MIGLNKVFKSYGVYFFIYKEESNMKKTISSISAVVTLAALFVMPMEAGAKEMSGKDHAFNRKLGNC